MAAKITLSDEKLALSDEKLALAKFKAQLALQIKYNYLNSFLPWDLTPSDNPYKAGSKYNQQEQNK